MKIGILTFHDADNYGAVLQAYALQEVIKQMGYVVEIIDYKQENIIENYKIIAIKKNNIKAFIKSVISSIIKYKTRKEKKIKFTLFRNSYLDITKESFSDSSQITGFDVFIVGSDQVWNSEIIGGDKAYYLDFCTGNERKISYAASVGKDYLNNDEINNLIHNISEFDSISVREDSTAKLISELTGKSIPYVVDPTLLTDENIWNKFNSKKLVNEKYLFVYGMMGDKTVNEVAERMSKELDLEIVSINSSEVFKNKNVKLFNNASPEQFVSLIKHASFVVTNSFHGTAFSILFNKDFLTIPHKSRSSRMVSLLKNLKLEGRIVTNQNDFNEKNICEIDYSIPNNLLELERKKSQRFLKEALYEE